MCHVCLLHCTSPIIGSRVTCCICTTVACLPPIRGLEKYRVIGHKPHFSNLCSLSCLKPKGVTQGYIFSACDWWKAFNCGTSHIDSSEAVVYVIPSGLLAYASLHLGYIPYPTASLGSIYHMYNMVFNVIIWRSSTAPEFVKTYTSCRAC